MLEVLHAEHLDRAPIFQKHHDLGESHEALFIGGEPSVTEEEVLYGVLCQRAQLPRSRSQKEPGARAHDQTSIADLAVYRHRREDDQRGRPTPRVRRKVGPGRTRGFPAALDGRSAEALERACAEQR